MHRHGSEFEGRLTVNLTTPTLPMQIAEAKDHLVAWLRILEPPSRASGKVQDLRLVGLNPLTYELTLRDRVYTEARTIL